MTKVSATVMAIQMLLWPILGSGANSDYFYNSVTPSRTVVGSRTTASQCSDPYPVGEYIEYYPIAYEVNGASYCGTPHGGVSWPNTPENWVISIPSGQKVNIKYALRKTINGIINCSAPLDSMYLYLQAPAMGINHQYLNDQGQWVPSFAFFSTAPSFDVWNDLYNDVPPKGRYVLQMGCDTWQKFGVIEINVN